MASTGSSKHSSIRGSKHDSTRVSGNPQDGRHFSIEMAQPGDQATSAVVSDRVSVFVMCCASSTHTHAHMQPFWLPPTVVLLKLL